jgi:RecA-family ATPase
MRHESEQLFEPSRVRLVSASTITLESGPPYLVKGLVHKGDLSVWYGPSGSGKTFVALWLAHCVATGASEFFGRRVKPGRVALFSLEGASGLSKRVTALQQRHGAAEDLYIHRAPLTLFDDPASLSDMQAAVLNCQADLVIVDTLSRTMAGANENSPEHMTQMLSIFGSLQSMTGAHVMLVHHTGKDESVGARGHSSLRAAADVEVKIQRGAAGERSLEITKGRDDADGQTYGFRLDVIELGQDEDGDPISTCIVEASDTPAQHKPAKLSPGDKQALAWLSEAI